MSVTEIEKTIKALPLEEKAELFEHLIEEFEDYIDSKIAHERMANPDFIPYEEFEKELFKK